MRNSPRASAGFHVPLSERHRRHRSPSLAEDIDARNYEDASYGSYVARDLYPYAAFNNDLKGLTADQLQYAVLSPIADISFIDDARTKFAPTPRTLTIVPAPRFASTRRPTYPVVAREERNVDQAAREPNYAIASRKSSVVPRRVDLVRSQVARGCC